MSTDYKSGLNDRRSFLKKTTAAGIGISLFPSISFAASGRDEKADSFDVIDTRILDAQVCEPQVALSIMLPLGKTRAPTEGDRENNKQKEMSNCPKHRSTSFPVLHGSRISLYHEWSVP